MAKGYVRKILSFWPIVLILLSVSFLFYTNYTPGTWLLGWDSTQPELNLGANLMRELNAVWQEYRGLGLLDGMAHAANLVHLFYIYILSLLVSPNLIRYAFVFLMHALGGVGTYFLVSKLTKVKSNTAALVASFFYLLNPGVVQMFYAPLELFIIHFAFLPWLFLALIKYFEEGSKKSLFWLFVANLAAVSQAHVPTIFIVYFISLIVILLFKLLESPGKYFKKSIFSLLVVFVVNSFWAMPYVYSAFKNTEVITNSKINRLSNPEIVLFNRSFGDFKSVALFRGFSLDYTDWEGEELVYQLQPWREHLFTKEVEGIGLTLFALGLVGVLVSFIKREKALYPFAALFFFSFANLATEVSATAWIRDFLIANIPYYEAIFRFSFTKFVILYVLTTAVFLGYFISTFGKKLAGVFSTILIAGIFYVALPAFQGNFLYERLRIEIPQEYFEVFDFFEERGGRIAILPQPSFWGWEFLTWGYRGSGFLWQGINNPTLHRAFDPWSGENETYYNELSTAFLEGNVEAINLIFEKYQVSWVLLDRSIYQPGGNNEKYVSESEEFAEGFGESVADFGKVSIYSVNGHVESVSAQSSFRRLDVDLSYSSYDTLFATESAYIRDPRGVTYPLINFDKRKAPEVKVGDGVIEIASKSLNFPNEKLIQAPEELDVEIDETKRVVVRFEATVQNLDILNNPTENFRNCDLKRNGKVERKVENDKVSYSAFGGGIACEFFALPDLFYDTGYILRIKGENRQGRSLKLYVVNWKGEKAEMEELLPEGPFNETFFVLPKSIEGSGYTLNLETRSFGSIPSENSIEDIQIIPFPYELLTQVRLVPTDEALSGLQENNLKILEVRKTGTSHYFVNTEGEGLLTLGQGYEDGWKAYQLTNTKYPTFARVFPWWFGEELTHVKVNSWANGWMIPGTAGSLVMVFWPQYLEYGGFLLLLFVPFFLVNRRRR